MKLNGHLTYRHLLLMSTNISGTLRGLHEHSIGTLRRLQGIVHHA